MAKKRRTSPKPNRAPNKSRKNVVKGSKLAAVHRPKSHKKSKKKSPTSSGSGSSSSSSSKNSIGALFDPNASLTGDQINQLAQYLSSTANDPQIAALQQNLTNLTSANQTAGDATAGKVGSYYQSLAQEEAAALAQQQALGARAQGDVSQAGQQSIQNIAQAGATANANLNQPSSARDQLQQLIAAQQGYASQENQAQQSAQAGQTSNYTGLSSAMAQANQMRGAQNVSDINQQTLANIGKLQSQFAPNIAQALGNKASDYLKAVESLRSGERNYTLGLGALGVKQQAAQNTAQQNQNSLTYRTFANKQQARKGRLQAKSRKGQKGLAKLYNQQKLQQQNQSLQNQLTVIGAQQGASGGGSSGVLSDPYKGVQRAIDLMRAHHDSTPKAVFSKPKRAIGVLVSNGIDPTAAKVAVRKYTKPLRQTSNMQRKAGNRVWQRRRAL